MSIAPALVVPLTVTPPVMVIVTVPVPLAAEPDVMLFTFKAYPSFSETEGGPGDAFLLPPPCITFWYPPEIVKLIFPEPKLLT